MIRLGPARVSLIRDTGEDFIDATIDRALEGSDESVERSPDGAARILTPLGVVTAQEITTR